MSDRDLVRALKAVADETRFRMVREIAAVGELSCGEIATHFAVSQPTISHHLKLLLDVGVVATRTQGKHHFASVNQVLLKRIGHLLVSRLAPGTKRELSLAKRRPPARK